MFAGSNHLLVSSTKGEVFGIGDNSLGQLGIGEDQPSAKKYQMVDFLKNQKTVKLGGYQNLSFFITEGGTLYYAGQISSQKKIYFPKEAEFFEDDVQVIAAHASQK